MNDIEPVCILQENEKGVVEFVLDPQQQKEYPHKFDKSKLTYSIIVKSKDAGIFSKQRKGLGLSLTTWGAYIPVKFKRVKKTDNPDIQFFFLDDLEISHIDGIPKDLLDYAQKRLKDNRRILAFAWYPKTSKQGIIVFNDANFNWDVKDHYKRHVHYHNLLHTAIHELGHTLGLSHSEEAHLPDVMDPYYHDQVSLSQYDIDRIQAKYGKRTISESRLRRLVRFLTHRKRNL